MTDVTLFWLLIAVVAVGTFALRSVPIWLHGRAPSPRWLDRLLRHVPAAALTALVVPGALYVKSASGAYGFAPERTIAAVAALIVAVKTRSVVATLLVGMAALWTAQAVL